MTTQLERPVEPKNGFGITSFILGIVSAVFGMVPIMSLLALPCAIVGLGLGIGGWVRIRHHRATNRVMTWIGIVLSILGITLSIYGMTIMQHGIDQLSNL